MNPSCLPIFLALWLSLAVADPVKNMDNQCGEHCLKILKPMFDHLEQLKELSDTNSELKARLNNKSQTINDLHSQVIIAEREVKTKDDLIIVQKNQIENQNELLHGKDEKINTLSERIKETQILLEHSSDHIKILESQISVLGEKLDTQAAQLKDQKELHNLVNTMTKDKIELQSKLANVTGELELRNHLIKKKDSQIREQSKHITTKDNQINGLSNAVKSVSKELTLATDDLLKCNGTDRCPSGSPRGIYKIKSHGLKHFEVPCNETGWMTIQKRFDGSENFNRPWQDYKSGFGDVRAEFFLGLERIYQMTRDVQHELYIKLGMFYGSTSYIHYDDFKIGSEAESYYLKSLGQHNGPAGDSLTYNLNDKFSTFDRDNDKAKGNCAEDHAGGWWYKRCCISTLNAKYYKDGIKQDGPQGLQWGTWQNFNYNVSLTFSEMMIRPKSR
ncbi:angiopoietin-related protein 7 [Drosophila gunungcola]|uniref:Fibrinogen C-terminal domain-containing protein n=1 Tax=Drosophila gunungcola TaxID=103775 RepID=A0A9P9YFF8_9MUSC|nr:angiopoietin-related protein 7 [Drosophila gunungcola]KAI8035594.1 hypothetical protein M5D96_011643 [Drosophila gunungcola]